MIFRYKQTFDEIIRQVTIHCSERGLLMLRVRDEINMTLEVRFYFIVSVFIIYGFRRTRPFTNHQLASAVERR